MEDTRTEYVEDSNREALIKHWEVTLSDASHAVYVAQQQLDKLYRQRYIEVSRDLGSTGMQLAINEGGVHYEQEPETPPSLDKAA